eukprot:RCo019774
MTRDNFHSKPRKKFRRIQREKIAALEAARTQRLHNKALAACGYKPQPKMITAGPSSQKLKPESKKKLSSREKLARATAAAEKPRPIALHRSQILQAAVNVVLRHENRKLREDRRRLTQLGTVAGWVPRIRGRDEGSSSHDGGRKLLMDRPSSSAAGKGKEKGKKRKREEESEEEEDEKQEEGSEESEEGSSAEEGSEESEESSGEGSGDED